MREKLVAAARRAQVIRMTSVRDHSGSPARVEFHQAYGITYHGTLLLESNILSDAARGFDEDQMHLG